MAQQTPAYVISAASHPAALFRQAIGAMFLPGSSGIFPSGGAGTEYAVAQQASPNMSVQVGPGRCVIQGSSLSAPSGMGWTAQGTYFALNDSAVTLTIAAADPTNPRIDAVYVAVRDAFYSGANNDVILAVITGAPAASPSPPALPANAIRVANIAVGANAITITNSNIASTITSVLPWTYSQAQALLGAVAHGAHPTDGVWVQPTGQTLTTSSSPVALTVAQLSALWAQQTALAMVGVVISGSSSAVTLPDWQGRMFLVPSGGHAAGTSGGSETNTHTHTGSGNAAVPNLSIPSLGIPALSVTASGSTSAHAHTVGDHIHFINSAGGGFGPTKAWAAVSMGGTTIRMENETLNYGPNPIQGWSESVHATVSPVAGGTSYSTATPVYGSTDGSGTLTTTTNGGLTVSVSGSTGASGTGTGVTGTGAAPYSFTTSAPSDTSNMPPWLSLAAWLRVA